MIKRGDLCPTSGELYCEESRLETGDSVVMTQLDSGSEVSSTRSEMDLPDLR